MAWTATINKRPDGAYEVGAYYSDGLGLTFDYSAVIHPTDAATFVANAKAGLASYQTQQTAIASAVTQLETALNA